LQANVYCGTIHNNGAMETIQVPYNWWMDQDNMVYIHNGVYSHIRKSDTMWSEGRWMQLEDIMLSKVSQVQKDKGQIFSLTCER
jgi:hypothetical protein